MFSIERQKYTTYEERLRTFDKWPSDKPQIQAELAEVGFWYTGVKDCTECFDCQLALYEWKPNDSPFQMHKYWSSNCDYLNKNQGNFTKFPKYKCLESRSNTFDVLPELKENVKRQLADAGFFYNGKEKEILCFHCGLKLPDWKEGDKLWNKHLECNSNCGYLKNNSEKFIQFPNYQSYESRLSTFDTWPASKSQTKEKLAEAGIFYNKNNNETWCFYCGKDLKNWRTNDVPWLKHYDCNPECKFVKNRQNLVVYPLYQNIESRLNTFSTWPASKSKIKESLANAGFFYTGKSDVTICFHCGIELQDWTIDCNPDIRHITHFHMCKYLLQRNQQ